MYEYFVETYDDDQYKFERHHHVSTITASNDEEAIQKAFKLAKEIEHGIYQISTKNGYEKSELPQPIWDFFNGSLRDNS